MAATRIEVVVKMVGIYAYARPAYTYGMEDAYIYTMVDDSGKAYVWKTTTYMGIEIEDANGWIEKKGKAYRFEAIHKDDVVRIKASVKREGDYQGKPQTELTRVAVVERLVKAETPEERRERVRLEREAKAKAQRESVQAGDFLWRMPYKQYKDHYSDCETVEGSFERRGGRALIEVIIRKGRMVESGTRFQHYHRFGLENAEGERVFYKAISEENAIERAVKEFGGTWKVTKIYY